ncbi:hypothetical protein P879_05864 [Paragonimus westermani]|uniref:C2H2-type domain-containing protein n=1 Tax=Paragonimus westermani TaxID=34504 RepID=A0A8T0DFE2_9TREM|nr:hypothetical protein P879_05864 [Paragonimus westermani]
MLNDALNTVSQDANNPPQPNQGAQTQVSNENEQMDSAMSTMLMPNIYLAQKYLEMGSKLHDTMLLSTAGTVHPVMHPYNLVGWDSVDGAMDVRSLVKLHSAHTSGRSVQPYCKVASPSNPIGLSVPFGDSGCMSLTEDYSLIGGGRRSTSTPMTIFDSSGLPTAGTMPTISPTNCDSLERFHDPFHSDAALVSTSPPRSTVPQPSNTAYRGNWYQSDGDSLLPTQPIEMRIPSLANVKTGERDAACPDGSHSDSELNLSSESVRRKNREDIKIQSYALRGTVEIFRCPMCEKDEIFGRGQLTHHLQEHQSNFKREDYKHVCCFCFSELSSNSSLERHLLTHTNHRPFTCAYCDKAFTTNGNLSRHVRTSHQLKLEAPGFGQEDLQKTELPWFSDVHRPPNIAVLDNAICPNSFQTSLNLEPNNSSNFNSNVGIGFNDELFNYSTTLPSSCVNIPGANTMSVSSSWLSIAHPRMSCISLLESTSSQPSCSELFGPSPRLSNTVKPLVSFGPTDLNTTQPRALSETSIHANRSLKQSNTFFSLPASQDINQPSFEFMTSLRLQTTNWLQWLNKPHQHPPLASGVLVDYPGNTNDPPSTDANDTSEFSRFSRPSLRRTPSLDGRDGPMTPNTGTELRGGADVQTKVSTDSQITQASDQFVSVWTSSANACNLSDNTVHSADLQTMGVLSGKRDKVYANGQIDPFNKQEQKRLRTCPPKRFGRHWSSRWKCAKSVKVLRKCRPTGLSNRRWKIAQFLRNQHKLKKCIQIGDASLSDKCGGDSSACETVALSRVSRMGQTVEAAANPLRIPRVPANSPINVDNSSMVPSGGKSQRSSEIVVVDEDTAWDLSMPRHVKTETPQEMSVDEPLQLVRHATNDELKVPPFELFNRIQLTTYVSVKDQNLGMNLPVQLSNTPINLSVSRSVNKFPLTNTETLPSFALPLGGYGQHNLSEVRYLPAQNIATPDRLTDFKQKATSINPIAGVRIPFVHKKNSYKDAPKLITCPIPGCNQKFPWNSSLKRHILTHTPHKPFACTRCTKSFSTKSNRERHMERVHQVSLKRQRQRIQCQMTGVFGTGLLNGEQRSDGTAPRPSGNPSEPGLSDSTRSDGLEELREDEILSMCSNEKQAEDISNTLLIRAGDPVVEPNPERLYSAALLAAAAAAVAVAVSNSSTTIETSAIPSQMVLNATDSILSRTSHRGHWTRVNRKGRRQHSAQLATKPLVENVTPLSDKNMSLMYQKMKPEPIDQFEPPMDLTLRNSSTPTQSTARCPICYAEVVSRSFRRHVSLHQSDNPVFRCHLCQLSFRDRITTLRHWCFSHKDEWKRFVYKFGLCHDTSIETLITTLNQSVSDSGTSSESLDSNPSTSNSPAPKSGLTGDMRYVSCCICLHRFGSHQDLQRHMRSHTGERPFVCPDCGKEFSLKHSMHRHYRVHVKQSNQPPVSSTFSLIQQPTTETQFSTK